MVFGLIIRSGLVVGTVYYTRKVGIWGSHQQSEELYNGAKNFLCPYVVKLEKQLPFDVPKLPEAGEVRYLAKHYYNQGVKETFRFVHMLPCYAGRLAKKAKDTFEQFAESPSPATQSLSTTKPSAGKAN